MSTTFSGEELFRSQDQIVADLKAALRTLLPDAWTADDGLFDILFQVFGSELEGITLALQHLLEDFFIQTMGLVNLRRIGDQYGLAVEAGISATGNLLFSGAAGTPVDIGSEASTDESQGDPIYFITTAAATIPSPGTPTAPTVADAAVAGNVNATVEYSVTFLTAQGETEMGPESTPLTLTNSKANITAIPTGGTGTTGRRIYRSENGGLFKLVTTISDNTTTTYLDNIVTGGLGGNPPDTSTAERVLIAASSEETGVDKNVMANTIVVPTSVRDGITDVTNPLAFSNGIDEQDIEAYRQKLIEHIRNPRSGSPRDLEEWAKEDPRVEIATVFPNLNLAGAAAPGTVSVRIAGPGGTIPDADTISDTLYNLSLRNLASITLLVGTFTAVSTNVTVTITLKSGFVITDVRPDVQAAISAYINSTPVGGLLSISHIHSAAVAVNGVESLVVNTPSSDQTTAATSKRIAGTITVN